MCKCVCVQIFMSFEALSSAFVSIAKRTLLDFCPLQKDTSRFVFIAKRHFSIFVHCTLLDCVHCNCTLLNICTHTLSHEYFCSLHTFRLCSWLDFVLHFSIFFYFSIFVHCKKTHTFCVCVCVCLCVFVCVCVCLCVKE